MRASLPQLIAIQTFFGIIDLFEKINKSKTVPEIQGTTQEIAREKCKRAAELVCVCHSIPPLHDGTAFFLRVSLLSFFFFFVLIFVSDPWFRSGAQSSLKTRRCVSPQ